MQSPEFTILLRKWSAGDESALPYLIPVVYAELHRLASARLRNERFAQTLQPTALIHEAYLKLVDHDQKEWHSRAHFFSVASHIMREILVDHSRKRHAAKRGGEKVPLNAAISFAPVRGWALLQLDEALNELAGFDKRKSRLIELKYFGGFTGQEISEALGISVATITREMRLAEAWLQQRLSPSGS